LFSGTTQALKEFTLVTGHVLAPGFLACAEYRSAFSNQRFFLTDTAGVLDPSEHDDAGPRVLVGTRRSSW
jgi:hypothetical protein